jgi:hypothetical protein
VKQGLKKSGLSALGWVVEHPELVLLIFAVITMFCALALGSIASSSS